MKQLPYRIPLTLVKDYLAKFNNRQISLEEVCQLLGISKTRLYDMRTEWLRDPERFSLNLSGGNHAPAWPSDCISTILSLIDASGDDGINFALISDELARRHGFVKTRTAVMRYCKREFPLLVARPNKRGSKAVKRWQVGSAGELWQHDSTPTHVWGDSKDKQSLILTVDDATRQMIGGSLCDRETLNEHFSLFRRLFEAKGIPKGVYTDGFTMFGHEGEDIKQGKIYILVVDGSVREKCRRKFDKHGLQRGGARYHYVLRIDILLEGIAIPLIHEHIDMQDPEREKEDCEINASKRALMRLKMAFPRLPIMLLGDSLYACRPIAHLCKEMNWDYCFTLKEGRTPAVWQEVQKLMELTRENRYEYSVTTDGERHKRTGKLRWVEDVDFSDNIHKKLSCSVIEQRETFKGIETYYAWITSLKNINTSTVLACVQSTGRKRHTIEDQLNSQKNNGYGLEHVFCANENAGKNYYTIMQIAVLLWTLFYDGLLKRVFKWAKTWSQIAIAMMLREGLRLMHRNTKDFKFAQLRFGT